MLLMKRCKSLAFPTTLKASVEKAYISTILLNPYVSQLSTLKVATYPVLSYDTASEKGNR